MTPRKMTAALMLAAAVSAFAVPQSASAAALAGPTAGPAASPEPSVQDRYPRGLRDDAVIEPPDRPAKLRRLAARGAGVPIAVDVLDRDGAAPSTEDAGGVYFYPLDGSDPLYADLEKGHLEGELPAGDYVVFAFVQTPGRDGTALVYRPRVPVKAETKLVLDAREARPVSVSADRADARTLEGNIRITQPIGGEKIATVPGMPLKGAYVTPTATEPGLVFTAQASLTRDGAEYGSPYVYNAAVQRKTRIPADLGLRIKTADQAKVRARYGTEGRPVCAGGHAMAVDETGGLGHFVGVGPAPAARTEYYTPGVEWWIDWMNTTPDCGFEFDATEVWERVARFPGPGSHTWDLTPAPFGPARPTVIWGTGNEPSLAVPMHSTWQGTSALAPYAGAKGTSVLRDAEGREVYRSDEPGTAHGWPAPPPGTYTLTVEEKRNAPYSPLAIQQEATWEFEVRDEGVVRLPSVRYRTPLSADATAKAGAKQEVVLAVDNAQDARPSLQVSYDDGQTWRNVAVRRKGEHWAATLTNPASGYVSLRTAAAGAEQTVIRAYAIK